MLRTRLIGAAFSLLLIAPVWGAESDQSVILSAGDTTVTTEDVRQYLLLLPEAERQHVAANPDNIKQIARDLYRSKRMAAEAERLKLDADPQVQAQFAYQRLTILANALREYTIKQLEQPDFTALAKEHYAAERDKYQLPAQFKAAHILKKVQCACEREQQRQALAALRNRIQAGEDFAAIAQAESDDKGSAKKGGDLGGWRQASDFVAPFAAALTKLKPGELSEIVETEFGFHLIKKSEEQAARQQSFDEVRDSIEQELRATYLKNRLAERAITYLPPTDAPLNQAALDTLAPK